MKQNVVDCSFRLPGDTPRAPVKEVPCGFDPDAVAAQQPETAPESARKPAPSAKSRKE